MLPADQRYDVPAQILHWLTAIAVFGAFVLIQVVDGMPKGPERAFVMGLHKSFGVVVLALFLARAVWRQISPPPAMPAATAPWMAVAAKAGHAALYLLMLAVPVAGIVMSWSAGRPVDVFGLFTLPTLLPPDPALKGAMEETHEIAGNLFVFLAGAHAVVAIVHQYVLKDGTLSRMLPGSRAA